MRYLTALAILLSLLFVPLLAPIRTKPMAKLVTISEDSLRELARLRDLDRRLLAIEAKLAADPRTEDQAGPRTVRWGKTTTNDEFPDYPTSGNTVLVELGDYVYDNTDIGDQPVTWEAYDPPEHRIARTFDGSLPDEGTEVPLQLHHGRWWIESFSGAGIQLGIVTGSAAMTARTNTPPLPDISYQPQYSVRLVTFEYTSGNWQLTRSDTSVQAIAVSSFPIPQNTLVMLLRPLTSGAPWIAIPNISPACNWQVIGYLRNADTTNNITDSWNKLSSQPDATWILEEEHLGVVPYSSDLIKAPVYPARDGITINAPGVYRVSLWGECYLDPATDATATSVDIAIGNTADSVPWSQSNGSPWTEWTLLSYATALGEETAIHMIPRVSIIVQFPSSQTFPLELSVFARLRGYVSGDGGAYLRWVRVHVEPAAIGENQDEVGFPGWNEPSP